MKLLKEKKGIIISFIIGVIIASSITVYAYSYFASDISYTKPGTETAISVEEALNDLYTSKKNAKLNIVTVASFSYVPRTDSSTPYYGTKTIDIKSLLSNYSELTKDNFILKAKSSGVAGTNDSNTGNNGAATFTVDSYENGIVTITLSKGVRNSWAADINFDLVACYLSYE